jgi:methylthioribose-1-phosphate isomerase
MNRVELSRAPLTEAAYFAVEIDPASWEVVMLDQRRLPREVVYYRYRKPDEVVAAIRDMVVRGAPAIGISAAYALALQAHLERGDAKSFLIANGVASRVLNAARPTAVNLAWGGAPPGGRAAGGCVARSGNARDRPA